MTVSIAQFCEALQGTALTPFRGLLNSTRILRLQTAQSLNTALDSFNNAIDTSIQSGSLKEYAKIDNPTKGKLTSSNYGKRCCQCLKVHQWKISSTFHKWHHCTSCSSIFCDQCGGKLATVGNFVTYQRQCAFNDYCGGTTEFLY